MVAIFKAALKNKNLISLCVRKVDWDKRIIGYVKSITNKNVIIDLVDIFGSVVKSKSIAINTIVVVEINDNYNQHLEKLKKQGDVIKKAKPFYYYNKGNRFSEKLELLLTEGLVCTIFFGTEYKTGIIKSLEGNILVVKGVGYRGTEDGESYCKLDRITKIRFKGPLEEKISFLQKM